MKLAVKKVLLISGPVSLILLLGLFIFHLRYRSLNPEVSEYRISHNRSGTQGLIAHWPLNQISNEKIEDASGNNNHGKICSEFNLRDPKGLILNALTSGLGYLFGLPRQVVGVKGNALEINGRQWISCGNIDQFNIDTFTISLWVWREGEDINVPTIMAKGSWPFHNGWWLCTAPNSKYIDMGIAWGKGWTHIESGYELPYQEWHHLAVTMDNVQHEIVFFVDGIKYGSAHDNVPTWLSNWSHDMFIGDYDGSGSWPWFGKIDEVYFFNRILNEKEIFDLYNNAMTNEIDT